MQNFTRRTQGRGRTLWIPRYNIKMNLKCIVWEGLTQDSVKWTRSCTVHGCLSYCQRIKEDFVAWRYILVLTCRSRSIVRLGCGSHFGHHCPIMWSPAYLPMLEANVRPNFCLCAAPTSVSPLLIHFSRNTALVFIVRTKSVSLSRVKPYLACALTEISNTRNSLCNSIVVIGRSVRPSVVHL